MVWQTTSCQSNATLIYPWILQVPSPLRILWSLKSFDYFGKLQMKRLCTMQWHYVWKSQKKSPQHCERATFTFFSGQKFSFDRKKLAHNAFNENFKFDILSDFQINILARKFTVVSSHAKLMPKLSSNRLFLSSQ